MVINVGRVVVIGGGASGLVAAIVASSNHEVTVLESNDKCGKKILLTGNGKCNYWNEEINSSHYYADNIDILEKIITEKNQKEVLDFLEKLGIYPRIKNGYYYPYSNQATSVRTLLVNELEKRNIKVLFNYKVTDIKKNNDVFTVYSNEKKILADQVIVATGSKAFPKTGSDGSGYALLESLGHMIHPITPSLVPLIGKDSYFKDWEGVRSDSKVILYVNNEKVKEEIGEIQLTNYGISGICTFNISGIATKSLLEKKKVVVEINFLPSLEESFYNWFTSRNERIPNHTIEELLESILSYKLMYVIFKKAGIEKETYWQDLTEEKKKELATMIEHFSLEIVDSQGFDRCQVATGGIPLTEVNPSTMESNIVKGLYIVGELLDVDGMCGGFNLAFASISGYLAGRGISC